MDHILLLAAIALFVLILGVIWKWLRKLQRRSRIRRGNNYLYQEYNYEPDIDYGAIDIAWDNNQGNITERKGNEEELDWEISLDEEELETNNKIHKSVSLAITNDSDSTEETVSNYSSDSSEDSDDSESPDDD